MEIWWATGGIVATILALVSSRTPPRVRASTTWLQWVLDQGHGLAWALVALGLGLAALVGDWTPYSGLLCVAGGLAYVTFVAALAAARSAAKASTTKVT